MSHLLTTYLSITAMKIKALVLGALMAVAALPAAAEGYNRVGVSYENESYSDTDMSTNGFGVEYTRGFGLSADKPLFLEAGLKATFGFWSKKFEDIESKFSTVSLNLPVNVTYSFPLSEKWSLSPYTGLNFRYRCSAKSTYKEDGEEESESWFDGDNGANRFQMGWNIGARVNYGAIGLGVGYTLDFIKFHSDAKINTGSLAVAVSYTF